jgi:hypothetical protein
MLIIAATAGYYFGYKVGYNRASNDCIRSAVLCPATSPCVDSFCGIDEPVINLYPTKTEPVSVQVNYPAGFTRTDPTYNPKTGWQVLATPSGTLTNLADNKQYPYLIWEGNPPPIHYDMSIGFVVPGSQTSAFLNKELPTIGLSPAETAAFIAYWQPRISGNKYNLIHFAGKAYTDYAKLQITPQPDSLLRVLMVYEPLQQSVSVSPQTFPPFQRKGFTVVEWGGTQL